MVVDVPFPVAHHGVEGRFQVGFGHACVGGGEVQGFVEVDAEVTAGVAGGVLFKGHDAEREPVRHHEVVGDLVDDGGLADARARREQHKLPEAHPAELAVQPRIGDLVARWRRLLDVLPQLGPGPDAVGPVGDGSPQGVDEFLALARHEAFIGVLHREAGDLGLARTEQEGAFLRGLLPRLVHVEGEDHLVETLQPFEAGPDVFGPRTGAVGEADHGPFVALKLADGEAVDLAFGDDDLPAAPPPEGLPEQHGLGCGAAPTELLALEAQVLGYEDTLVVIERGDVAVFAPCLADAVPEVFACFLRDAPRFQGHERIYRDGIKRNGVFLPVHAPRTSLSGFVVAAYMAVAVPVAVAREVVAVPVAAVPLALRARLVMGECAVFIGVPLTAFVVFSVVHGVLFPLPPRMPACS